jgi:uncharacterized damage-inducible protein DinB
MSAGLTLNELLDYSDHEREKWKAWVQADSARLNMPFQAGARFPTVWSLLEHIFLVERRHLARLEGGTPPDSTGVAPGDVAALFEYADTVRADLRQYVAGLDDTEAASIVTFSIPNASFTVSRRKLAAHILLHELRHWAQTAYAARVAGIQPPGEHDLLFFPGMA